jgi:hypothetical protein
MATWWGFLMAVSQTMMQAMTHLGMVQTTSLWRGLVVGSLLLLFGCSGLKKAGEVDGSAVPQVPVVASNPWTVRAPLSGPVADWQHQVFPGKQVTRYAYAREDERDTIQSFAQSSASALRHKVFVSFKQLGQLQFSWKVPELIPNADMALRDADDSPVRVMLVFEGDRSKFSMKNAMLSELAHTLTGEPMPYATLMYVWCNIQAPGTVIINPRTDRIRKLVVESGTGGLNQWRDYQRDIAADFEAAFGEPPGALLGIGIMTDSDNTRSETQAWYGPVTLTKR